MLLPADELLVIKKKESSLQEPVLRLVRFADKHVQMSTIIRKVMTFRDNEPARIKIIISGKIIKQAGQILRYS